ncbi:MAG: mechanosensitive ion channel [Acidobacteriota bacterium]|nr:mechanosensitive ion channel [Blastocatellia bacterium]MDW8412944.1 mechanosensitive ion channel [Acidobacteriota bacterium]
MRNLLVLLLAVSVVFGQVAAGGFEPDISYVDAKVQSLKVRQRLNQQQLERVLAVYAEVKERISARDRWVEKLKLLKTEQEDLATHLDRLERQITGLRAEQALPQLSQDASVEQLEQSYRQSSVALELAKDELVTAEQNLKELAERRRKLPELLGELRVHLSELDKRRLEDDYEELAEASQLLKHVSIQAVRSEMQYYEAELMVLPQRERLLIAQRELAALKVTREQQLNAFWRERLAEGMRLEAERAVLLAEKELQQVAALLRPVAEENLKIAKLRAERRIAVKIDQTRKELEQTRQMLLRVQQNLVRLKGRIETVGLTDSTGVLLRKVLDELPDLRDYQRRIVSRQQELSNLQTQIFELEEQQGRAGEVRDELFRKLKLAREEKLETDAERLLQTRSSLLKTQLAELGVYFDLVMELDAEQRQLVADLTGTRKFIEENILWVKTLPAISLSDFSKAVSFVRRLTWGLVKSTAAGLLENVLRETFKLLLVLTGAVAVFYLLLRIRKRLHDYIVAVGTVEVERPGIESVAGTLKVFFATIALSAVAPALLVVIFGIIHSLGENLVLLQAVAAGLGTVIVPYLTTRFLLAFGMRMGLAQAHLEWSEQRIATLCSLVERINILVIPSIFFVSFIQSLNFSETEQALTGRFFYVFGNVALAYVIFRLLHPIRGVVYEDSEEHKYWYRYILCICVASIPVVLAVISALGYTYAAMQLWEVFGKTVLAASYVIVFKALAYTLIVAKASKSEDKQAVSEEELKQFKLQAYSMVSQASIIALTLYVLFIWMPVIPALNYLNKVELWSTSVEVVKEGGTAYEVVSIKLTDVVLCAVVLVLTVITARNVPGLVELIFLQRLPLDAGTRYAFILISRYVIVIVGTVLAAGRLGVKWGHVQWMIAAVSVGLGFGLQEIFSNFISGLIILLERPVRVGDIVTVEGVTGTITRIRIRSTTVTDYDMKELIIPNKNFITGQVINWTLSSTVSRVSVPIQVAYGTDTDLVTKLLLQAVEVDEVVLKEPPPVVVFSGFGDSGLEIKLFYYIPNRNVYNDTLTRVNRRIDTLLREAGVKIPYPQRDIHIVSQVTAKP